MGSYCFILHRQAYQKAETYLAALQARSAEPGACLQKQLTGKNLALLSTEEFLELLNRTRKPQIFAESQILGDGTDWNLTELSILGDCGIAVPVHVFDNGVHRHPVVHERPFSATLVFIAGALLRNDNGKTPADWNEVTRKGKIDEEAFCRLYERRLLPALMHCDARAERQGKKAFVTLPGLGCGQFAGVFRGQLGGLLRNALVRILRDHGADLKHIKALYYDPYEECTNERLEIGGITVFVRPFLQGNAGTPQLCPPRTYEEASDDFSDCELASIVAWDHVSWPGNDFYAGARATDDGVKAAATDSMSVMTGVQGTYDPARNAYLPPDPYCNWRDVIEKRGIHLDLRDRLHIYP